MRFGDIGVIRTIHRTIDQLRNSGTTSTRLLYVLRDLHSLSYLRIPSR